MSNDPRMGSFNVLLVLKVPKISTKAHFTLGVKAMVELELIIPIGAINEISPKSLLDKFAQTKKIVVYVKMKGPTCKCVQMP
jgi:hypothetical protein